MATPKLEYTGHLKDMLGKLEKTPVLYRVDASGNELSGPLADFLAGEYVVIKNKTYKVVYLNAAQVTLEPVSLMLATHPTLREGE